MLEGSIHFYSMVQASMKCLLHKICEAKGQTRLFMDPAWRFYGKVTTADIKHPARS